ncbi:hypothetical protein F4775DRAFT_435769 [Biscogniauxia sp. FL1348]|nr:hypothetical protein F4775DRAFT_435769 [Biscogniauxia sp. FL1348]
MSIPPGRSRDLTMMPGLTLNTGVGSAGASAAPQTHTTSAGKTLPAYANTSILPPPPPAPASSSIIPTSVTPVPPPQIPYTSTSNLHHAQSQAQQAKIHTQAHYHTHIQTQPQPQPQPPAQNQQSSRSSSPVRPTYSPITPPLNPTTASAAPAPSERPTYTYNAHANTATGIPAPRPEPIDFDSNPDVLALKSAISILQMQRRKAEADMAALDRAKSAALAEPGAFVRDLTEGRVGVEGDRLFVGGVRVRDDDDNDNDNNDDDDDDDDDSDNDDDSSSDSDSGDGGDKGQTHAGEVPRTQAVGVSGDETLNTATTSSSRPSKEAGANTSKPIMMKPDSDAMDTSGSSSAEPKPWTKLPKPQSIVRCPPINWSQYAVVGESLDKLHSEQLSRPAQGSPAVVTADGRFEFRDGPNNNSSNNNLGKQERLVGIAAPYAPGKDRLMPDNKRSKGPKR